MIIKTRMTNRRFYDEDGTELSGYCYMPTPRRMSIQISRRLNRTINQFAGTALHELIHAWINLLQTKGFDAGGTPEEAEAREEEFVSEVERIVVRRFHKKFKGR